MAISTSKALFFSSEDIIAFGGNFDPLIAAGQWWRLLTSVFIHGNIQHLAANMFALWFIGIFLEPVMGTKKMAFSYLGIGIIVSFISMIFHDDYSVRAGASGAIFGMYGMTLSFMLLKVIPKEITKGLGFSIILTVLINLIFGFAPHSNVDNAGHFLGLFSGLISGFFVATVIQADKGVEEDIEEEETNEDNTLTYKE